MKITIITFTIIIIVIIILSLFSYRHTMIDGKYYKAIHIKFPGYTTIYRPENEIDLSKWVGSEIKGLESKIDSVRNPEIEASFVLKAIGYADSTYDLKQKGEHWVLYSSETSWNVWDWGAYHRIGKWKLDKFEEN